jgi:hypothetical protein
MPRVSDDGSAGADGIRVHGVYLAMLDREREHHNRYGRDGITWVDDNDPSQGCVVRPRELLDLLEAGRPVIVRRIKAGHKRSTPPVVLPWDPRTVRFVQVARATPSPLPLSLSGTAPLRRGANAGLRSAGATVCTAAWCPRPCTTRTGRRVDREGQDRRG